MKNLQQTADLLPSVYHWHCVHKLRARMVARVEQGVLFTDPLLVKLANRVEHHGMALSRMQHKRCRHIPVETEFPIPA